MKAEKNAVEWTVFGVSLVLISATIALLVTGEVSSKEMPPDLRIETRSPSRSSGGFAVPVIVTNSGDTTAEEAHVEVALMSEGEAIETAELVIAFVPRQSRREGWVVFREDPSCCSVVARAVSYEKP